MDSVNEFINNFHMSNSVDGGAYDTDVEVVKLANPSNHSEVQIKTSDGMIAVQSPNDLVDTVITICNTIHPRVLTTETLRGLLPKNLPVGASIASSVITGVNSILFSDSFPPTHDCEDTIQ